jgi:hypothetical protein
MAQPLIAGMPPECALVNGCSVQFVAIDPSDGSTVTGVTISNASIYVETTGSPESLSSGPFMLVPGPGSTS